MTSLNSKTVKDEDGKVVYTAIEPKADHKIAGYMHNVRAAGFKVDGNTIMAKRGVILAVMSGV